MLSIAKLAPGGQRYYLDQADGRVGHVRSVASGVEDYYLVGPEAAGFWIGSVARELDLTGREVTEDALTARCALQISRAGGRCRARSADRASLGSI